MIRSMAGAFVLSLFLVTSAVSAEFSADMVMDSMAGKTTGKLYFKNDDTTRTDMMGVVAIMKRPYIYQLFTDTRKYVVQDIEEMKKTNPALDAANLKDWIDKNNLKKTGSEKLQGYPCDIYEGDVIYGDEDPPVHIRMWHTPKLGYPLRHESVLPAPMGTVSSRLENIQLGPQPGSLFEIPEGYTEAKSAQEAMGMEGMPSFGGAEKGQAPSREEMEKMMKEMMEKMGKQ